MRQQRRLVARGGTVYPSAIGTESIVAMMQPDKVVVIATDVPGRTPMTFLGREVIGSFGSARIAAMTSSPVIVVTSRRDAAGSLYLQVEEPLDPLDFAGPRELLDEILRIHGEAVLAWPEALDVPTARWNHPEE